MEYYSPTAFGGRDEEDMVRKFNIQLPDARNYFLACTKPQLDRAYKLYMSFTGDRAREIKAWQSNVFVPYTQAVVETMMPRILDARPDFTVQGRNEDDQLKAIKLQSLADYIWEVSKMDETSESIIRAALVFGTGYLQVSWKKDVRTHKFLQTKDITKKKYKWKERDQVYYDAPFAEWVDNYGLWYDWHNVPRQSKQFWFKRLILTGEDIKRRYPMYDPKRLKVALTSGGGDLTDYGSIRNEVKKTHSRIFKGADSNITATNQSYNAYQSASLTYNVYQTQDDPDLKMHEVFEWWRPFEDAYAVMVNKVPILQGAVMPIPYDFKEAPFIEIPYLKLPNEFEGIGLPLMLESPQIMLNMIKNQRLDATILNIHKMWIVNPLANINKDELVTRPFGIIWSPDPNGVREVQFTDIKPSSYKEEDLLKSDMRYACGVDDFSMGAGQGGASSATEVRHLRESTLERVRLFINHMGSGYSDLMRYWMSMYKQFFTDDMIVRIVGEDGRELFPLIQQDDLKGEFDFKAAVIPSIAGKNDVDKKQGMDLFQLLITLPFIDQKKLTSKILHSWNWSLDSIVQKDAGTGADTGMDAGVVDPVTGLPLGAPPVAGAPAAEPALSARPAVSSAGEVSPEVISRAMQLLGNNPGGNTSSFSPASAPVNLLQKGNVPPPTAPGIKENPRGLNRGGKVNTNIPLKAPNGPEAQLLNRANNIQR